MTNEFYIEIDDKPFEFTDLYPKEDCIGGCRIGNVYGLDEKTLPKDSIRNSRVTGNCVAVINAYNRKSDGSIDGIQGIFKNGKWGIAPDGKPLFSVWERIT